eukprot:NODE_7525_length_768_cov_36.868217_g6913_i0.p1 GENE.NODE_7525_length_768_cov_36.868217_g6913_i0~~NODE_7525_length_768_cov_36.868217_g6913_i0.p1  ORF type:complete len:224 (-),score=45.69 NODE_7525_length_768_cov_36.868217_g6913_i0:97-732(-)
MRTCVNTLQDVPTSITAANNMVFSTEDQMVDCIQCLLSAFIVIPGHPEHGPLYLFQALKELIQTYQWEHNSSARARLSISMIQALSGLYQDELPYHFASGTTSNDELYAGNKDYKTEIEEICTQLVDDVLTDIAELDGKQDSLAPRKVCNLALDLLNTIAGAAEPTDKMKALASKVNSVVSKSSVSGMDSYIKNTTKAISSRNQWSDVIRA